jgi:hypothetical protein
MAIEGPLKELGIHDVFQLLDLGRKTGVLTVVSPLRRNRGSIYFDGGAVVYASIQSNPHPLGALLVRAGKITEADLHRARTMQQSGDPRRLGEILVAIGALGEPELQRHVSFQVEEVVFEIMNWQEGHFSFVEGPLKPGTADAMVRVSTETLLMEGARRIDEWSRIEKTIPNLEVVPMLAPVANGEGGGALDLRPADWEVLALIDGERNLRSIAGALGRSDFEVAKTVFGLESTGVVTVAEAPRAPKSEAATSNVGRQLAQADEALERGDLATARNLAEAARDQYPEVPAVYVLLARMALATGETGRAEEHLRQALRLDPLLATAHLLLGDAVARLGRLAEAVEWWQRGLKLEPEGSGGRDHATLRTVMDAALTLQRYLYGQLRSS